MPRQAVQVKPDSVVGWAVPGGGANSSRKTEMIPDLNLTLERRYFKTTYTIGRWFVEGMEFSDSLEDKDRGLTQDMPTSKIYLQKVYGKTAIPYGKYEIKLTISQKFSNRDWAKEFDGLIPELIDVPGFVSIRIHPGTTCEDTDGCLLPGMNRAVGKVLDSRKAYYDLMDYYLMPAHKAGQKIYITITKK